MKIFEYLNKNGVKPIVVGGFVRDTLLSIEHLKDIDVEVYNIDSYEKLKNLLSPFGKTVEVGKSFGVCKITVDGFECDFSLPRTETKIDSGHKGFAVSHKKNITFKEAARRRDFSINALGLDVMERKLLDCFGGLEDLQTKTLRAVDATTFTQDPLRVLRGVVFAARFEMRFDKELFSLCASMVADGMLNELPKERIYGEMEKLFHKAKKPSIAFRLLQKLQEEFFFKELFLLPQNRFEQTLNALDTLAKKSIDKPVFYFAALVFHLNEPISYLRRFTHDKKLLQKAETLLKGSKRIITLCQNGYEDFDVKVLATEVKISDALILVDCFSNDAKCKTFADKAKRLGVLEAGIKPLVDGKKLLALGFEPSKKFKKILETLYEMQLKGEKIDDVIILKTAKNL